MISDEMIQMTPSFRNMLRNISAHKDSVEESLPIILTHHVHSGWIIDIYELSLYWIR